MGAKVRTVEQELARMASRSYGVVTRAQLVRAGVTRNEIRRRLENGTLIQVHRGVYCVGHRAASAEASYLAAVLACGDGAVLSGRAAAWLLAILKGPALLPEVTAPTERRVRGVRTRRSRHVEATTWRGIPVTTVPRTLVDLAAVLSKEDLSRACHEAGVRHRTTPAMVEAVLARRPTTASAATLRAVLHGDVPVTLSKLERRFLAGCARPACRSRKPTEPRAPAASTAAGRTAA